MFADIRYLYRMNANRYRYPIFGKTADISANPIYRFTDMPSLVWRHGQTFVNLYRSWKSWGHYNTVWGHCDANFVGWYCMIMWSGLRGVICSPPPKKKKIKKKKGNFLDFLCSIWMHVTQFGDIVMPISLVDISWFLWSGLRGIICFPPKTSYVPYGCILHFLVGPIHI